MRLGTGQRECCRNLRLAGLWGALSIGLFVGPSLAWGQTKCKTNEDCDDANACTSDHCTAEHVCAHESVKCDDENLCTDDSCDPKTGCTHVNNTAKCEDADKCTTNDACSEGKCVGGAPLSCDDEKPCTDDTCDPKLGCVHHNHEGACDDGNACTVGDSCVDGACAGGKEVKCDDENPCTDDACDPQTGCVHENKDGKCDDGNACTKDDTCLNGACAAGTEVTCDDEKPCTDDVCDPKLGCLHQNHEGACDDGNACTVGDSCMEGSCAGGKEVKCDDENPCTHDACDPKTGCVHENKDGKCDDGNACTKDDTCLNGACAPGDEITCDDEKPCTDDACDPKLGCTHTDHDGPCDDGNPCTDGDSCIEGKCSGGKEQDCDDGLFCNGEEKCERELGCTPGDNPCPDEKCDEEHDTCLKCAGDAECDDGLYCTGAETCDPEHGCQSGDKPCGEQPCDEETDTCTGCGSDAECDDGLFCNGEEKCHPKLGCRPGHDPCDKAACDEETNSCTACESDADCDDGQFCNGAEICKKDGGCGHGDEPCPAQLCDEEADACIPDVDPASAFGLKTAVVTQLSTWTGLMGKGDPFFGCDEMDENLVMARGFVLLSLGADDPVSGLGGSEVVWGDANHIDPAHGGMNGADVFEAEVAACNRLQAYIDDESNKKPCPFMDVVSLQLGLAGADRRLAEVAIADAQAAGADSAIIAEAMALFAAADAATKAEDICGGGLSGYEAAWETAVYASAPLTVDATQSLVYAPAGRGAAGAGPWITVSSNDLVGYGSGTANFVRAFPTSVVVSFAAPLEYEGRPLLGWNIDGLPQPLGNGSIQFSVGIGNHSFEVLYGECVPRMYGDLTPPDGNGLVDVDDILFVLDAFMAPNPCVNFPEADLFPCGATCATVDVDDILAELDAFSGIFACPDPCAP